MRLINNNNAVDQIIDSLKLSFIKKKIDNDDNQSTTVQIYFNPMGHRSRHDASLRCIF